MAIAYEQLGDDTISAIPVAKIQTDGYLFMWVINAKFRLAIEMISYWGYTWARRREVRRRFVDEIAWVKCNRNRRMAKSHGFYLQHSKETCFVAKQPAATDQHRAGVGRDLLRAPGPEPEAHRYIRAHRAVSAERWAMRGALRRRVLPGDLRAQEQPPEQLGHGGERAMTVF